MRSLFAKLIAVAAAFALVAAVVPTASVNAQALVGADSSLFRYAEPVGFATGGDASSTTGDDDVALLIRYVGTNTSGGTVVVAATTGDITFATGAVGSSAADDTLECPVSGALGGIIDVSNASCDTIGEVVDIINGSPNWRAVPVNALAADVIDASNNGSGSLLDFAEAQASGLNGVSVYWNVDGDASNFNLTQALITPEQASLTAYLSARVDGSSGTGFSLTRYPFAGQRTVLQRADELFDMDSGAAAFEIYSVKMEFVPIAAEAGTYDYRETATLLYTGPAIVDDTASNVALGSGYLLGKRDEKLIVRVNATADIDIFTFSAVGFQLPLAGR
jgi:hypothetical protein